MTAQAYIYTGTEVSTGRRKPSEVVAEYDAKRAALPDALAAFEAAGDALKSAATIGSTWGNVTLDTGRGIYSNVLEKSLLQSAWRHVLRTELPQPQSMVNSRGWHEQSTPPLRRLGDRHDLHPRTA